MRTCTSITNDTGRMEHTSSEKLLHPRLVVEGRSIMVNAKAKVNDISGPETCDKPHPVLQ